VKDAASIQAQAVQADQTAHAMKAQTAQATQALKTAAAKVATPAAAPVPAFVIATPQAAGTKADKSAREVIDQQTKFNSGKAEAVEFLRNLLGGRSAVPVRQIEQEARTAGILKPRQPIRPVPAPARRAPGA
jgi:hypothetical protein